MTGFFLVAEICASLVEGSAFLFGQIVIAHAIDLVKDLIDLVTDAFHFALGFPAVASLHSVLVLSNRSADPKPQILTFQIYEPHDHAAQMRYMSDLVAGIGDGRHEFDGAKQYCEVFGFDGNEEVEVDGVFGESDGVGDQKPVNGAACADGRNSGVDGEDEGGQTSADAGQEKVLEEAAGSPCALHHGSEHPQRQHVEDQMPHPAVEKHVRDQLPDFSVVPDGTGDQPHLKKRAESSDLLNDKDHRIDDDQILDRWRPDQVESKVSQ